MDVIWTVISCKTLIFTVINIFSSNPLYIGMSSQDSASSNSHHDILASTQQVVAVHSPSYSVLESQNSSQGSQDYNDDSQRSSVIDLDSQSYSSMPFSPESQ